jgi:chromosomal replication initiation ATPase DnaA
MTPSQAVFHERHKAIHRRIAMAADRARWNAKAKADFATHQPTQVRLRREYENTEKSILYIPKVRRALRAIADEFGITTDLLISDSRKHDICVARFFAVALLIETTSMSLPAIGRHLGGRDHTTIMNSRDQAKKFLAQEAVRNRFDDIKARLAQ